MSLLGFSFFGSKKDENLWSIDLKKHPHGEFSFAMVKANQTLQDYAEVRVWPDFTYVGVYDGHGGHEAAEYVSDHLYRHIIDQSEDEVRVSDDDIARAFIQTEEGFMEKVRKEFNTREVVAANGSCCLLGIIHNGAVRIANLGDSRAVLGREENGEIVGIPITVDHNVNDPTIRDQVTAAHRHDPNLITTVNDRLKLKGLIEVTRAIGDANLKYPQFRISDQHPRYHLPQPITRSLITTNPDFFTRNLEANDKFIIIASDGLWNLLNTEEAVAIVRTTKRNAIAKTLIEAAMRNGAVAHGRTYDEIKIIQGEERRIYHDDITVVVLFIDNLRPPKPRPVYAPKVDGYRGFVTRKRVK